MTRSVTGPLPEPAESVVYKLEKLALRYEVEFKGDVSAGYARGKGFHVDYVIMGELCTLDLFEEVMDERLVGAAQAGGDADVCESPFRTAARGAAFEQPAFDAGARNGRPAQLLHPGVERARDADVEQDGHARRASPVR